MRRPRAQRGLGLLERQTRSDREGEECGQSRSVGTCYLSPAPNWSYLLQNFCGFKNTRKIQPMRRVPPFWNRILTVLRTGRTQSRASIGASLKNRLHEYVHHLHEHFIDPVVIKDGRYLPPSAPSYNITMKADSLAQYAYPHGAAWLTD